MTDEITIDGPMTEALELVARMEGVDAAELVDGILRDRLADYRLAADHVVRAIDAIDLEDEPWNDNPDTSPQQNGEGPKPTGSNDTGQPSTNSPKQSSDTSSPETTTAPPSNQPSTDSPNSSPATCVPTPDPDPEPEPDVWPCEHCDRTFPTQQRWAGHQSGHTDDDDGPGNDAALDAIDELTDAGWERQQIGDLFGITGAAVVHWVRRGHVPASRRAALVEAAADDGSGPADSEGDIVPNDIADDVTPDEPCKASGCYDHPTADAHGLCGRHARIMSALATAMREDLTKPVARRVALDGLIEHGDNVTVLGAPGLLRRHADNNGDGRDPDTCRAAGCDDRGGGGWCNRHRHAIRTLADNIRPEVGHAATKQAAAAVIEHGDDANYDLAIESAA